MHILSENDRGYVALDGNELIIGSKIDDPPKVRLTSPLYPTGGGGGAISFNYSREIGVVCDGHQQDEIAMIRVEQAEDVRGQLGNRKAELNLMLADGSGVGDVVKPFACVYNAVTRILPAFREALRLELAANESAEHTITAMSFPNKLVSPDGRVELDIQNADALNMTLYEDGIALWSITTGITSAGRARFQIR